MSICYIDVENSQNISGTPGDTYPLKYEGTVTCSRVGLFYSNAGGQQVTLPGISGPNTVWYFNGQSPTGYATSITLTSTTGTGTWSVASGADRINLSATSGSTTNVSGTGSHFSGAVGDTCVTVKVGTLTSPIFCLTVRTPWKLTPNSTYSSTTESETNGYSTSVAYDLYDNLSVLMTQTTGWNEVLGAATNQNGSNWATCCGPIQTSAGDTGPLQDFLSGPGLNNPTKPTPTPTYNNPPSGHTIYRQAPQTIRVGNTNNPGGLGVLVQTDNLTYWIDHGSHENIVVPSRPPQ